MYLRGGRVTFMPVGEMNDGHFVLSFSWSVHIRVVIELGVFPLFEEVVVYTKN
jgi:hypothetical protein